MSTKTSQEVSYFIAQEAWIKAIDSVLIEMKQPMNQTKESQQPLVNKLKEICKEALEQTQKALLLANTGKPSPVQSDSVGWTKAKTMYSHPTNVKANKHSAIVDKILQSLLQAQVEESISKDEVVSVQNILNAQEDALDETKDTIILESADKESKLEIDKETGSTTVYEKDSKTGSYIKKTFLYRYWNNVKNFVINIWKWFATQIHNFKEWVKSLFGVPKDCDVIYTAAT